jgi:hypothetical protein
VGLSWFNVPGCTPAQAGGYLQQYIRNLVQWFRDQGLIGEPYPAYIYANECKGQKRFHSHLLMAVPTTHREAFRRQAQRALLKVLGLRELPKGVLWMRFRRVPGWTPERQGPVTRDQWTAVTYMLKGADPAAELGTNRTGHTVTVGDVLGWTYENPGQPFSRRQVGVSESLGLARREKFRDAGGAPFHSFLELQRRLGALDWRELYTDYYLDQAEGRRGPEAPVFEPAADPPDVPVETWTYPWHTPEGWSALHKAAFQGPYGRPPSEQLTVARGGSLETFSELVSKASRGELP